MISQPGPFAMTGLALKDLQAIGERTVATPAARRDRHRRCSRRTAFPRVPAAPRSGCRARLFIAVTIVAVALLCLVVVILGRAAPGALR